MDRETVLVIVAIILAIVFLVVVAYNVNANLDCLDACIEDCGYPDSIRVHGDCYCTNVSGAALLEGCQGE